MCRKLVKIPLRLVWCVLIGLLAAISILACDNGLPTAVTERSPDRPAPTSTPAEPPSVTPTSTPAAVPVSTSTPTPVSTAAPTSVPEPTEKPTAAISESTPLPELVVSISSVSSDIPPYDRDDWRHWIDEDGDCKNTRHEVLIEESRAAITYKSDRECQVKTESGLEHSRRRPLRKPANLILTTSCR